MSEDEDDYYVALTPEDLDAIYWEAVAVEEWQHDRQT
jgi:hypothetical protein